MPRASDSPTYRASDSPSVPPWASDPAGPDAWASDPEGAVEDRWPAPTDRATDSNPDPATDPAAEWDEDHDGLVTVLPAVPAARADAQAAGIVDINEYESGKNAAGASATARV